MATPRIPAPAVVPTPDGYPVDNGAMSLGFTHYSTTSVYAGTVSSSGQAAPSAVGTAGTSGGYYGRRGNAAGTGFRQGQRLLSMADGFYLSMRFRMPSTIGSRRFLCGLSSETETDSDTLPSSYVGWRWSSPATESGPRAASRAGGTPTLGVQQTALIADHWYVAVLRKARGESTVHLELHDITAGTMISADVTETLPDPATLLGWVCVTYNLGSSKDFDFASQHQWTDEA